MTATTRPMISYFLKVNQYAGKCAFCQREVKAEKGFIQKNADAKAVLEGRARKWQTVCPGCVIEYGRFLPDNRNGRLHTALDLSDRATHWTTGYCTCCQTEVALVKSKKGKYYLANTRSKVSEEYGYNPDILRVAPWDAHHCPPDQDEESPCADCHDPDFGSNLCCEHCTR